MSLSSPPPRKIRVDPESPTTRPVPALPSRSGWVRSSTASPGRATRSVRSSNNHRTANTHAVIFLSQFDRCSGLRGSRRMGGHRSGAPWISNRFGRAGLAVRLLVLTAAVALVAAAARPSEQPGQQGPVIGGPYGRLLADSADLGPARGSRVQLIAALRDSTRPLVLMGWADKHGLSVQWQPGQDWAVVQGAPEEVAEAFGVAVHNYRSPD